MQEEIHISDKKRRGRERSLKKEEELIISLMKLKLNMNEQYTAFLFGVSESTVSRDLHMDTFSLKRTARPDSLA